MAETNKDIFTDQWIPDIEGYREGSRYMDASRWFELVDLTLEAAWNSRIRERSQELNQSELFDLMINPSK